ncbi:MFS transporter [Neolewinella lacunae]|uniref:MFS transporter n=1 Tax=Neolewinella lacunae TaxID=1517758 RepID=A0A923T5X1_9BACT|nr:MFS transporter [Neolewinella lacunae]MBC6992785.1 MFS transporter [Neolewinella lacunae]MDN3636029.1 MFS transporter [Neolewinella lacunae]
MSLKFRLSALNFLQNITFASTLICLGNYLLQTLHFSGREVGMVYATMAVAATLTPPIIGWLADYRFSVNRLLLLLNLLCASFLGAAYFATEFWVVYVLVLGFYLCFMPTFSLVASLCFHQLPDAARQYPRVRVWGTVSFMLVGLALSLFGWEASALTFLIGCGGALASAWLSTQLPAVPPQPGFNLAMLRGDEVRSLWQDRGLIVLLLAILLSTLPSSFYYSFLNPFLNEVGWKAAAAKMSLGQLCEIAVVLATPFMLRRVRFRRVVFWGLLVWGLRYVAFSVGRPGHFEWLLYAGIAVQGFAFAWIVIAAQIYVNNRVPGNLRSTAQGLVVFANQGLGAFFGAWIAGEVVLANTLPGGGHDWSSIWVVPAVAGVLSALLFWYFFPRAGRLEG